MTKKLFHRILQLIREEKGDFKVLFTALSVILLAFFILLNAMSTVDEKKVAKAVRSIRGSFGVFSWDLQFLMGGTQAKPSSEVEILAIGELETHTLSRELEEFIMRQNMGQNFGLFTTKDGTIISLSDKVGFRPGSAEIEPQMLPILNKIAMFIKRTGMVAHIEGHSDNIPIKTKQYQSNWELSTARAVNILKYLVEKGEVAPTQIAAAGYGGSRPLFGNDTLSNRSHNRRVEIVLLKNEDEL